MVNQGNRSAQSGGRGPRGPRPPQGDGGPAEGSDRKPASAGTGLPGPGGRGQGARIEKAKDSKKTVRRLLAYLSPYRWALISVFVLVILENGLGLAGPALMGRALDVLLRFGEVQAVVPTLAAMLGVYAAAWAAGSVQAIVVARFSQQAMRRLRHDLFDHTQTLSLSFFDQHSHGELMSRLTNDMQAISAVLTQNVTSLFSSLLTLVGIIVMMFVLNSWLALASMIVLPAMLWLVRFVGKRTRQGFREYQMRLVC